MKKQIQKQIPYKSFYQSQLDRLLVSEQDRTSIKESISYLEALIGDGNYLLNNHVWIDPINQIIEKLIKEAQDLYDAEKYLSWVPLFLFLLQNKIDQIKYWKTQTYAYLGTDGLIYNPNA